MKNLEQLIADLKEDEDLRTRLAAAGEDEAAVDDALAKEGYSVTASDIKGYSEKVGSGEPSEEELRKVAGGGQTTNALSYLGNLAVGGGKACW